MTFGAVRAFFHRGVIANYDFDTQISASELDEWSLPAAASNTDHDLFAVSAVLLFTDSFLIFGPEPDLFSPASSDYRY